MKSKLVEKLERLSRPGTQPLGFRTAAADKSPAMLLIARLSTLDNNAMTTVGKTKVDAILLPADRSNSQLKAASQVSKTALPWGASLAAGTAEEVKLLQEKGCDFIVFPAAKTAAAVTQQQDIGKIIQVEPSLLEGILRTINQLQVDCILLPEAELPLTVQHLMSYYHLAGLLRKPLLAELTSAPAREDLKALWEAGVNGLVIKYSPGQPPTTLEELKKEIDSLPSRHDRKKGGGAILPQVVSGSTATEEEEEDDDT